MAEVDDAITAIRAKVPDSAARNWFDVLQRSEQESGSDWERFSDSLKRNTQSSSLPDDAADDFLTSVGNTPEPYAVVTRVCNERTALLDGWVPARDLHWVGETAQNDFASGLGAGWRTTVLATLDERWPQWDAADLAARDQFLEQWRDTILAATAAAVAETPEPDPRALEWVPEPLRNGFESALGSPWKQAVLTTMDTEWPGWTESGPTERITFLSGWQATIVARSTPAVAAAATAGVATATVPAAVVPAEPVAPEEVSITREKFPILFDLADVSEREDAAYALVQKLLGVDLKAFLADVDALVKS